MVHPNSIHREILQVLADRPDGLPVPPLALQGSVDYLIDRGLVEFLKTGGPFETLCITPAGLSALASSRFQ